jgi:hypothetical protein
MPRLTINASLGMLGSLTRQSGLPDLIEQQYGDKDCQGQQAQSDACFEKGHRPESLLAGLAEHVDVHKDEGQGRTGQQPPADYLPDPTPDAQPIGDEEQDDDG